MSDRVRLWAVVVAGILLGASPVWAISEYKVATATGTGTAKVSISGVPNARVVALVSADGPSKAGSQAATVSGCVQSWVRVKRANTAYGMADVWSAPTGNLSGCTVTARLSSSGYFLRLVVIVLDGAAGIGSSVSASGFSGPSAATLTSLQPGSFVYGVGSDWSVVQGRTVLSGQRILAQSTPSGLGTFWGQALTGTTSASSLTVGTSAPASGNWNFAAVEILATDAPPPPPPPPPSCTFSVAPSSLAFPASGGSGSVTVSASDPTCAWSASGSGWLSVSPSAGTGSGAVSVTGAANSGSARSGSVTVAGESVSVTQDGAPVVQPLTIACPANQTKTSPDGQPIAVTYPDATTSGGTAPITVVGSPASGSLFAVGTTSVTQTATSSDGQTKTCGISVIVLDGTPPAGGNCTVILQPGASLSSAVSSAASGSTICLTAGSYPTFNASISKASPTTIAAAPGVTASQVVLGGAYVGTSQNLTFKDVTIRGASVGTGSAPALHIRFSGIRFTDSVCINNPTNVNQDTVVEWSTFAGLGTSCTEGRLGVTGNNINHSVSSGIVIRNNVFGPGGCSDGVQINGGARGVQILNNEFVGIKQGSCTAHSDPIQFYGAVAPQIIGNYFHGNSTGIMSGDCNGSNGTYAHNVFVSDGEYPDQIVMTGSNGGTYNHNTFVQSRIRFGNPNSCGLVTNVTLTNNIGSVRYSEGQGTGTFTISYNNGMGGTNAIAGTPTFVGGSTPTTWEGFRLAPGSVGDGAANDGQDIGVLTFGPQ